MFVRKMAGWLAGKAIAVHPESRQERGRGRRKKKKQREKKKQKEERGEEEEKGKGRKKSGQVRTAGGLGAGAVGKQEACLQVFLSGPW